MPFDKNPCIDWSQGSVLIQSDGTIFCSPNSKRVIVIPDEAVARNSPFHASNSPSDIKFFEPVWWDWCHGWLAFVPLSPSFLCLPFHHLSWKLRVVETTRAIPLPGGHMKSERGFQVHGDSDDAHLWFQCSNQLTRKAEELRLFYHIPGSLPPMPTSFGLDRVHKSLNGVEKCIEITRRWLVVWMGFISYMLAQLSRPEYAKPTTGPLPCWYTRLLEREFFAPWLDGLSRSTVGTFDQRTVRSGVVLNLGIIDKNQPQAVQWFLSHHIPCWYPITRHTEELMNSDPFLHQLIPPRAMMQKVLTKLFSEPELRVPLVFVTDDVLDGPSIEATCVRNGFCVDAGYGEFEYWDDDLTEHEIATICGTYVMYTGSGSQTTKIFWFPPPQSVEGGSYDSIEWTPRAETLFQRIFEDARKGTFQPRSAKQWRETFRDFKGPRVAFENNRTQAAAFLMKHKVS